MTQGNIDFEHEGEIFRLNGDIINDVFIARLSWIKHLTPEKRTAPISKQDQLRLMNITKKYCNNDKYPIIFMDDNYNVICDTRER